MSFINDIESTQLGELNNVAYDSTKKNRNLSDIQKYLQNISDGDLNRVVDFFDKLPFIQDFINLHMAFYFNREMANKKF